MPAVSHLSAVLGGERGAEVLASMYGGRAEALESQAERYRRLLDRFAQTFPEDGEVELFSAPGRTEVGGNHTDHNAGRVLAAAVDLDIIAAAAKSGGEVAVIESEGYLRQEIQLGELAPREEERYTAGALTRGVCARMRELGYRIGGFHACLASQVPRGSGLSSSAAYEVLIASMLNHFYNAGCVPALELARAAQYAENRYFGKPCGLMDQTACLLGGLLAIDFRDFQNPVVRKLRCDFAAGGLKLVIVDTGASHEDLNEEYASIEREMKAVARALGGGLLREFDKERLLREAASLRSSAGDRAVLRALHFFDEDRRVVEQAAALERGDFSAFLRLAVESGRSSWMLLQNCYPPRSGRRQGVALALAVSEALLAGEGAWRVHGGGFAGTILAFVPIGLLKRYLDAMQGIFGPRSCCELAVRPIGTVRLEGLTG